VYYFANFMTVEKIEAIYKAIDDFQEILGKDDYGHCDECGWEIFSKNLSRKRGFNKSRFAEVCEGFDESGEPIEVTDCLLVEHLRYTQKTDTD